MSYTPKPRPTIAAEQWGCIDPYGAYWNWFDEKQARARSAVTGNPLARIINGRVCDEHGEPFEVQL